MGKRLISKEWRTGKDTCHTEHYNEKEELFSTETRINECFYKDGKLSDTRNIQKFDINNEKDVKYWMDKYETFMETCRLTKPSQITYAIDNRAHAWIDKYNIVHIDIENDSEYFMNMVCIYGGRYFINKDGTKVNARYINDFDKEFPQHNYEWIGTEEMEDCIRQYYLLDKHHLGIVETYGKGDKYIINNSILLFLFDGFDAPVYLNWEMLPYGDNARQKLVRDNTKTKFKYVNKEKNTHHYRADNGIIASAIEYDNLIIIDDPLLVNVIETVKPLYYRTSTGKCYLWGSIDFNEKMTEAKNRWANY